MKEKLQKNLSGQWENHIFPFFWQHGEEDQVLLEELHRIYDSGVRAVCVEARPAPDFGKEPWFQDMELILKECRRLGMEFWLLDDKHFPTGTANGLLWEKYPHLGKHAVTERHMDIAGPVKEAGVMVSHWLGPEDTLLGIVACKRYPDCESQRMYSDAMELTDCYDPESGMAFVDLPEGFWRVFILIETPVKDHYIDMLRAESVQVLIEAVYEPHYARFREYFGTTFRGYFSDEPFILEDCKLPEGNGNRSKAKFPWNDNVRRGLAQAYGDHWLTALPNLWFPGDNAPGLRVAYMDTVTKLYAQCFCGQLGQWCRERGAQYIGHIIEDNNSHTSFISGGHYFRSLDGQDMAGVDVVLCQIVPGMSHNTIVVPCSYDISKADFFHFGLAKLASSHAHIQPLKKGRAMCEIFGAYGWAEGIPMMKWLTDHMLVRGINQFVPHAFDPKYPDSDCPPHFYAGGHNPLYRPFGTLMGYMNRVSTLLSDGLHHADVALYYHAEAEWSGEDYMPFEKPAKVLTENQIDFDVLSQDYLEKAKVSQGKLELNGESYRLLILPHSRCLPQKAISCIADLARNGMPVWCVEGVPEITSEGTPVSCEVQRLLRRVSLSELAEKVGGCIEKDADFHGKSGENLRLYHYSKDGVHGVFLTNEGVQESVAGTLRLRDFTGGSLIRYDPMTNQGWRDVSQGEIPLEIPPYGSCMLLFGALGELSQTLPQWEPEREVPVNLPGLSWEISFAASEAFDPAHPDLSVFREQEKTDTLYNIVRKHKRFAGFVKYETSLPLPEPGGYVLDLGNVGEVAWVSADGSPQQEAIVPPYRFFVQGNGTVHLTVITTSHSGYALQDRFSAYLAFAPVGLLGPVKLYRKLHKGEITG